MMKYAGVGTWLGMKEMYLLAELSAWTETQEYSCELNENSDLEFCCPTFKKIKGSATTSTKRQNILSATSVKMVLIALILISEIYSVWLDNYI
jgi:hypothetical protein